MNEDLESARAEDEHVEAPLIGAQIIPLALALTDRILTRVHDAGFTDIRRAHLSILCHLRPSGRRISDLADRVGLTKPSVVYVVDQLERRGYVAREPDPQDGRAVLVRPSERGWAVDRVTRSAVQEVQEEWMRVVGTTAVETFLTTLTQLAQLAR